MNIFFASNNSILLQLFMNFVYSIDMTAQVMRPTGALKVHTLDWQSSSRTVAERFQKLFELAEWADCKFLVGSEEPRTVSTPKFSKMYSMIRSIQEVK